MDLITSMSCLSKYGNLTVANNLITCCSHYLIIESRDNQSGFQGTCGLSEDGLDCLSVTGISSHMDKLVRAKVIPKRGRGSEML